MRKLMEAASCAAAIGVLSAYLFAPLPRIADGPNDELARSGCCSWHGGVCGCSGNRAACCDGTLSPTCGCD